MNLYSRVLAIQPGLMVSKSAVPWMAFVSTTAFPPVRTAHRLMNSSTLCIVVSVARSSTYTDHMITYRSMAVLVAAVPRMRLSTTCEDATGLRSSKPPYENADRWSHWSLGKHETADENIECLLRRPAQLGLLPC